MTSIFDMLALDHDAYGLHITSMFGDHKSLWEPHSHEKVVLYHVMDEIATKYHLIYFFLLSSILQHVMDGDLCEQFTSLDPAKQKSIANDLGRTPSEVAKKLEDIRTRYAF